jgi:hypothetical protein
MEYPHSANRGEIVKINDIEIKILNSFTLNQDIDGEYYEITTIPPVEKFNIDKDKLFDILCYPLNGYRCLNTYPLWI